MKKEISAMLLMGLWTYTAVSKLYDWHGTYQGLHNQVFPVWVADILAVGLPVLEMVLVLLLLTKRRTGLLLSMVLLGTFSIYILLIGTGIFGRVPCGCGGILNQLGWWEHLVFNLVFLGIATMGYLQKQTERRNFQ